MCVEVTENVTKMHCFWGRRMANLMSRDIPSERQVARHAFAVDRPEQGHAAPRRPTMNRRSLYSLFAKPVLAAINASRRSPLARPWMITAGLLAANLVFAVVVVASAPLARAQVRPVPGFCQDCYQGYHAASLKDVHATKPFEGVFGSKYGGSFVTSHADGAFYDGFCVEAHRRIACCERN